VRDAQAFASLLQEKYQFDPQYTTLLCDKEATRRNIYQALDRLVQAVTPQDNVVLYFSGHGEFRDTMDEGYWIPVDAEREAYFDFIPNQQIQHYLKRINSHHSFVVVDSCFSGALFTNRNLEPTERLETVPSRWLLTSGRKELVSDGKPGDHSPFAENVLLFLKQNQQPSLPISRLIDDVVHATAANARQTPRGEPIQDTGHKGGQLYFHLKRNEAVAWQAALTANSMQGYLNFEKQFPDSPHVREVRNKIAHLEEDKLWEKALRSDTITGYRDYLDRSPLKKFDSEAMEAIERLSEPEEDARKREAEAREARRRREAEERARREAEQRKKKEEKPPVAPFDWNRLKLPLAVVTAAIVIGIVIWQVANSFASFSPPEMVFVKGGTFTMGCTAEQGSDCGDNEKPAHQVTIGDFKIGKYDVTQAQWKAIMGNNPSSFKNCDQCPVESVSWNDIQEFIKKLNHKTGGNYRLPTEAEWEYAARGGQKSQQNKFAGNQNVDAVGWYDGNSGSKTNPVGKKTPNELGIYDMSGNVWEWCADWYGDYSSQAQTNPKGPASGEFRVLRGGSWLNLIRNSRVSNRSFYNPRIRYSSLGFRLSQD
jgi:formylglycine-generating enzyme required for sulfatase activity